MACDLLLFILHAVCCQKQEPELDTVYGTHEYAWHAFYMDMQETIALKNAHVARSHYLVVYAPRLLRSSPLDHYC